MKLLYTMTIIGSLVSYCDASEFYEEETNGKNEGMHYNSDNDEPTNDDLEKAYTLPSKENILSAYNQILPEPFTVDYLDTISNSVITGENLKTSIYNFVGEYLGEIINENLHIQEMSNIVGDMRKNKNGFLKKLLEMSETKN